MPIYDYHCTACGADTEVMHKISDPPAKKCPECGKSALVKQVSAAGFRLSGGGWYETDFKSGGQKNLAGDQGDSAKADAGKGDAAKGASDKPATADTVKPAAKPSEKAAGKSPGKASGTKKKEAST
jgi:putative FmdB family regulatory protein